MNPSIWWYVARASGIVAWLLLTASVVLGSLLSGRVATRPTRRAWQRDIHRWLAGLTVSAVAIHLGALVADSTVHFGLPDLAVPFASSWRPGATALGVVAAWLLLAVHLTSLGMRRLPRRAWRAVHLSSYAAFWASALHGAFAGTDRAQPLYRASAAVAVTAVVAALAYRLAPVPGRRYEVAKTMS